MDYELIYKYPPEDKIEIPIFYSDGLYKFLTDPNSPKIYDRTEGRFIKLYGLKDVVYHIGEFLVQQKYNVMLLSMPEGSGKTFLRNLLFKLINSINVIYFNSSIYTNVHKIWFQEMLTNVYNYSFDDIIEIFSVPYSGEELQFLVSNFSSDRVAEVLTSKIHKLLDKYPIIIKYIGDSSISPYHITPLVDNENIIKRSRIELKDLEEKRIDTLTMPFVSFLILFDDIHKFPVEYITLLKKYKSHPYRQVEKVILFHTPGKNNELDTTLRRYKNYFYTYELKKIPFEEFLYITKNVLKDHKVPDIPEHVLAILYDHNYDTPGKILNLYYQYGDNITSAHFVMKNII